MKFTPTFFRLLTVSTVALLGCFTAHAQTTLLYNVDCNNTGNDNAAHTYSGAAIIGKAGDFWNAVSTPATTFTEQTSTQGGPTITFTNNMATTFLDTAGTVTNPTLLMQDYLYENMHETGSITLGGLTPGASFSLILFGAGDQVGQGSAFSLGGATGGNSQLTLMTTGTDRNISNGIGDAYNTFTGMVSPGGVLTVTVASNNTTEYAILNGLQFSEVVPEPSTWTVLGLGGAGFLGLTLRRRRA